MEERPILTAISDTIVPNPETPEEMNEMMTLTDVAEYFGVNKEYVRKNMLKIKGFPYVRIGRRYFIHRAGLEKWVKKNYGSKYQQD